MGFTLAELLIALAILGVIATFTIPKVLQSQQDGRYNAITKEAAGAMSSALQLYRQKNSISAGTAATDLVPYLNYVTKDTTSTLDLNPGLGAMVSVSCAGSTNCFVLHNGAVLYMDNVNSFNGTASTNAVWFYVDPDGKYTGKTDSIVLFLYTNGRVRTWGTVEPNTLNSFMTYNPNSNMDPPWFSWN